MTIKASLQKANIFQRRIAIALAALGAIAAIQGALAIWAVAEAERHVWRGRVAADIQHGFLELSLDKQRLRNWVAQRQFNAGGDDRQRDGLLAHMKLTLTRLETLADQARSLDDSRTARTRQAQRQNALTILNISLAQLERGLASLTPPPVGRDMSAAWQMANEIFDRAEGSDLRRLLSDSLEREETALSEKRAQTNQALARLRQLWIGSSVALVMATLLMAQKFSHALRRPIQNLMAGVAAIRNGQLEHRIPIESSDEFSTVARSMNAMVEELANHRIKETDARNALEKEVASRTAALSTALKAEREMEARRRQLFADISHELRTPTTAIRGEAQVTLRGGDKTLEEYKSSLARIEDTSRQLGLSIDDLLTMARSDIDSLSLRRVPVDLQEVLDDAFSNGVTMARASGVILEHRTWPENLVVHGDADRLRQMLLTLIDNAIRYSHTGGIVHIDMQRTGPNASQVEVRIHDKGIGIPREELLKIFDRNHRAPNAVRHRSDGSGLGLSIARAIARGHDGDISITSTVEEGTVAAVTLPLASHRC